MLLRRMLLIMLLAVMEGKAAQPRRVLLRPLSFRSKQCANVMPQGRSHGGCTLQTHKKQLLSRMRRSRLRTMAKNYLGLRRATRSPSSTADEVRTVCRESSNKTIVELLSCTSRSGSEWGAIGVNASQLCVWLQFEVGEPAAALEARCRVEKIDVRERRSARRLQQLWRQSRLLVCGASVEKLLSQATPETAEESFVREVSGLARRARSLPPARHERAALRRYVHKHSGIPPSQLMPDDTLTWAETRGRLLPFLQWFKAHFPYDRGTCGSCGEQASFVGVVRPSVRERKHAAYRAELWHCGACGGRRLFSRYTSVPKILQTRQGRCGEYSQTMLQMLLALGWRARWVVDWGDHVWVELLWREVGGGGGGDGGCGDGGGVSGGLAAAGRVARRALDPQLSHCEVAQAQRAVDTALAQNSSRAATGGVATTTRGSQRLEHDAAEATEASAPSSGGGFRSSHERWVHIDPCEAALDEPGLYHSWGKNISFVIAFGDGDICDVTRQYAPDWAATEARRGLSQFQVDAAISKVRIAEGSLPF